MTFFGSLRSQLELFLMSMVDGSLAPIFVLSIVVVVLGALLIDILRMEFDSAMKKKKSKKRYQQK